MMKKQSKVPATVLRGKSQYFVTIYWSPPSESPHPQSVWYWTLSRGGKRLAQSRDFKSEHALETNAIHLANALDCSWGHDKGIVYPSPKKS